MQKKVFWGRERNKGKRNTTRKEIDTNDTNKNKQPRSHRLLRPWCRYFSKTWFILYDVNAFLRDLELGETFDTWGLVIWWILILFKLWYRGNDMTKESISWLTANLPLRQFETVRECRNTLFPPEEHNKVILQWVPG